MTSSSMQPANHLIHEKSPYLLQHAHNPVDWYPWGTDAFEKARKENKPILVSIGYSTCHWCHVMERESYEDPKVAALMNQSLVCIKVDREERPDVDKIYMTAVSAMTGSGGWPLNVFLTPDLKPFFGGTYFPPTARWGQPGWTDVIRQIAAAWADPAQRQQMLDAGNQITGALKQLTAAAHEPIEGKPAWLDNGYEALKQAFDPDRGGFSPAPKFPMPVNQNFLLRYYARTGTKESLEMALSTLRAMAQGGIYDQLGGGFARYSTDADWRVPHFEKMLYDNAQLAVNYLEAYQITRDPLYAQVARETLDYILRDMTQPQGGFYSAEDADSPPTPESKEKSEGAFYVWEQAQILQLLGEPLGGLFCFRYGVRENGNAGEDPHGEFRNKNVLYVAHPVPETARRFRLSEAVCLRDLALARQKLLEARQARPRPHLDDKIISGWNGLMISALAKGAQVLGDPKYLQAAQNAATFLQTYLYDEKTATLYRRWREGERQVPGMADDYAFLAEGLLDLFDADSNETWLAWAQTLSDELLRRFYDEDHGGFYMTAKDADRALLVRVKEDVDNVEPSASSIAALCLLRLFDLTGKAEYRQAAEKTLRAFGGQLEQNPRAMPQMLVALDWALSEPREIVIVGKRQEADAQAMLARLHAHFLPVQTTLFLESGKSYPRLFGDLPFLKEMRMAGGKATAYVCVRHACKEPTTDLGIFDQLLRP